MKSIYHKKQKVCSVGIFFLNISKCLLRIPFCNITLLSKLQSKTFNSKLDFEIRTETDQTHSDAIKAFKFGNNNIKFFHQHFSSIFQASKGNFLSQIYTVFAHDKM